MDELEQRRRAGRGLTAIHGALALIVVLVIAQMWLLTATLEQYLAGHHDAAVPAAIVSAILCAGCVALYLFVVRVDASSAR
jgi:hypothetical protein